MLGETNTSYSDSLTSSGPTIDVLGEIGRSCGPLPQVELAYEADLRLLWVTLRPEPKPVFTLQVVTSLRKLHAALMTLWTDAVEAPILFLAYRGASPISSLGGDLDFYLDCLRDNDRGALADYARMGAHGIGLNATGLEGRVISLATVAGRLLGGGIDPARACNVMIAEEQATFGYPEVHYNHFPISAVPILSRHAGNIEAERILISGADYSAAEFHKRGALNAVVPEGTGEDWIRDYARKAMPTHEARVALFKAFNRRSGNLERDLSEAADAWVDHIMKLKPLAISKLQRIAAAQERMLSRLQRRGPADGGPLKTLLMPSLG